MRLSRPYIVNWMTHRVDLQKVRAALEEKPKGIGIERLGMRRVN